MVNEANQSPNKEPRPGAVAHPRAEGHAETSSGSQASRGSSGDAAPAAQPPAADTVTQLSAEIAQLEDALLRAKADFQNLQRRATSERFEAIRFANAELIKSLLGVLDDLERSLAAAESPKNFQAVVDGLKLVHGNLLKSLRSFGLETIPALRERFDPTIHEALMQQAAADVAPGVVVKEVNRGYRLYERVLRPARVVVSKAPEETPKTAAATRDRKG